MRRWLAACGLVTAAAACSSLPDAGDGIVALEIQISDSSKDLKIGQSETLHARALNVQGDPVADALIFWRTPDTLLVTLDSVSGLVKALANTGTVRIQARTGTLFSNQVLLTLRDTASTTGQ